MKKVLLTLLAVASVALCANATDLTGKRIYVNPGHGSYGPNDRPMATIPYPNLPTTGMPDTLGFYESNTDMWKCEYLGQRLAASGATVVYSRTKSGPWPYQMVNGDYPDYTTAAYKALPDYEAYNRPLSEICEEVEAGNFDYFISVHSNAATDGSTTNYPLALYRGFDNDTTAHGIASKASMSTTWPYRYEMFAAGFDYASAYASSQNVRGDCDFYGSYSTATRSNGQKYTGYLGVLKHGAVGGLWEGYFHTYQPARHRALNRDYCNIEGYSYYRGIMDYFGATPDNLGYICGTVKDMDNKMVHGLYKYAARTNDQWIPCNGATVYLLNAAGDTLQSYQVDNLYNGIFAFYNLQPGTYHLFATCPGYFDLDATQAQANVVVTANTVTYPFIQLRDTSWQPEEIVYETYPDKSTGVTGLNGKYNFSTAQTTDFSAVVTGKQIRQVLVRDDNETYVLALDTTAGAHASHIYKINTLTGALIQEVSTAGTQGQYYPVYGIAFTADSVLVGCNYEECQFTPVGTFRTYYWNMEDLTQAPTPWVTTQWAGNFYNANVGGSFAVSGVLNNATIITDAQTTGSSHQFRLASIATENKNLVSVTRNQNASVLTQPLFGDYIALASPNSDDDAICAGQSYAIEYSFAADAQTPNVHFELPGMLGAGAFKYGGKSVIAAATAENGLLQTVRLYNITAGMSKAAVSTTNIALSNPASYYSVKPLASGSDIVVYVVADAQIMRYTTANVEQPALENIYAYNLQYVLGEAGYTVSFDLNTEAVEAEVVLYDENDAEVATFPVADLGLTANSVEIPFESLSDSVTYTWGVRATAPVVGNWNITRKVKGNLTRAFNTVNVYPETEQFGTIYVMDRAGSNSTASGLYVMSPDFTMENTVAYRGGQNYYGSPYRFGIASDGWVYVGDWADPHSGIYMVDPANPSGTHTNFFAGSQNSAGLWTNAAGVAEGSSTPSVYVYGTGADTKLLVYNEDPGSTLPANGLCVYNIGQPDGTILHSWDGAPSATMTFAGQANTNGNVWGCSKGVWVSQHRSAGNNNASATSLRFYDWAGNCTFSSHQSPTYSDGTLVIDGSLGSCFALSADESMLVLRGTDKNLMIFSVTWEGTTPTLTLTGEFKDGHVVDYDLLQFNWDYAGNIIASGNAGVMVIAVPKAENTCVTPARSSLTISKQGQGTITSFDNFEQEQKAEKFFRDGKIYIRKNGHVYTVSGMLVE